MEGVAFMVGLFIHILPRRIRMEGEKTLHTWLRSIQKNQVESEEFTRFPGESEGEYKKPSSKNVAKAPPRQLDPSLRPGD